MNLSPSKGEIFIAERPPVIENLTLSVSVAFKASRKYLPLKPISIAFPEKSTSISSFTLPIIVEQEIFIVPFSKLQRTGAFALSEIISIHLSSAFITSLVLTITSVVDVSKVHDEYHADSCEETQYEICMRVDTNAQKPGPSSNELSESDTEHQ